MFHPSPDTVNLIKSFYLKNDSLREIASKFKVTAPTIKRILNDNEIKCRNKIEIGCCQKKYKIDENYFENIDSIEKAYILGFIFADGGVFKNTLRIAIQTRDIEILEFIKNELKTDIPIRSYPHRNQVSLSIYSSKISKDLYYHGCAENKTWKIRLPKLEKSLMCHFVRGYFDGDGCACVTRENRFHCQISSNKYFLKELKLHLESKNISFISIGTIKNKNPLFGVLSIYGKANWINFYNYMYFSGFFLKRKREKFLLYFSYHSELKPIIYS